MKKFTIICGLVLISAMTGFAQFKKGTVMVGGTISGGGFTAKAKSGSTTTTLGKESDIDFNPQAGYFVMDNFALGAGIDLTSQVTKPDGGSKTTTTSTSFTPFARYYYHNFYGVLTGQVGGGNTKTSTGDDKYTLTGVWVGVGYAWLLNDHVAVEPQAGFNSFTNKYKSTSEKDIYSGPYIKIGLQVYLRR